jgi:hypothetical protein
MINAMSSTSLGHLNQELEAFANYVRLTEDECQSREYLIQKVKDSCKALFGVDKSQCQVFGSFAVKSVCTYESDIDLTIWGVVPPEKEDTIENPPVRNRRNGTSPIQVPDRDDCLAIASSTVGVGSNESKVVEEPLIDPNQKKKERILRWKKLINDSESQLGSKEINLEGTVETSNNESTMKTEGDDDYKNCNRQEATPKDDDSLEVPWFLVDQVGYHVSNRI